MMDPRHQRRLPDTNSHTVLSSHPVESRFQPPEDRPWTFAVESLRWGRTYSLVYQTETKSRQTLLCHRGVRGSWHQMGHRDSDTNLAGQCFILFTDHSPLQWMVKAKDSTPWQRRHTPNGTPARPVSPIQPAWSWWGYCRQQQVCSGGAEGTASLTPAKNTAAF